MYNNICSIVGDADSSSDCSGNDLEDPASIYWSDDDDDLDGNDDGSWENSEEDQNGHQWNTPQSNHQNPTHGDDGDDSYCELTDQNAFYDSFLELCLQILIT